MLNITRYLADQTFEAKMDGETHKFKIVPEFSSKLRANLYFGKDEQNSRGGITSSLIKALNNRTASYYKEAQIDESQTQRAEISVEKSIAPSYKYREYIFETKMLFRHQCCMFEINVYFSGRYQCQRIM